jgi:hypothetical protein
MLSAALEQLEVSPAKRATYSRAMLGALALMLAAKGVRFFQEGFWYGDHAADFSAFYIVAQRFWNGDIDLTYQFSSFAKMQVDASGASSIMPWTYPPQFDLLVAPLAFLPGWASYLLFTALTLAAYLAVLRAVAKHNFAHALLLVFPAATLTLACGQNGFLTGALIGLVCLHAERRQIVAGLALGAMIVKPHLAIAAGFYMLISRRWTAVATAGIVVITSTVVGTVVLGPHIWIAWLGAIRESAGFLEQGEYPLFRMISAYAFLYTCGLPAAAAFWGQVVVALLALSAVAVAVVRGHSPNFALGVVAVTSVMISPYAYDYDLPVLGIGIALLLPELPSIASPRERGVIYGLVLLAGCYGLIHSVLQSIAHWTPEDLDRRPAPAIAALAVTMLLVILLRILLRNRQILDASADGLPSASGMTADVVA